MKTIKPLLVLIAVCLLAACKNDDDNNSGQGTLEGTWKLKRVQGGFAGVDEQFADGAVTWTFNAQNATVTVVNNQIPESGFDFFDTGAYSYTLNTTGQPGECNTQMAIDELDFGCFDLDGNTLRLDQREADGFLVTLKR